MSKPLTHGRGYAWNCDFGLCHWAEPAVAMLMNRNRGRKPSPEAKAVAVRIIREKDYRRMMKKLKESK